MYVSVVVTVLGGSEEGQQGLPSLHLGVDLLLGDPLEELPASDLLLHYIEPKTKACTMLC